MNEPHAARPRPRRAAARRDARGPLTTARFAALPAASILALTLALALPARGAAITPRSALEHLPSAAGPPALEPGTSVTSTDVPTYWQTWAERTGYRQTSDYEATMRYLRQMEAGSRWIKVESFGTTGQGRELPLVIVSKERAFTPQAAAATGKPIVLVQCGIHSGEIEGKDAMLALVRDIAVLRTRANLLDSAIVLVMPMFSADAHERRGPFQRMNQNGPEEMGWRPNPTGLNLNRDYVKAETPEMKAFLANVWTRWWPHLLVDTHTTNGADYRFDLTYAFNHGAGVAPGIERWLLEAFENRVLEFCRNRGHLTAPYIWFRDQRRGVGDLHFGNSSPRLSHGFAPMHARPAILIETHMLKPYWLRVKATYDVALGLLEELRARPGELLAAVEAAEQDAIAHGTVTGAARPEVPLETRTSDVATPFLYQGFVTRMERSDVTGGLVPRYENAPWDTTISLYREVVPARTVALPAGYLVPQEWSAAREKLDLHGVRYRRFARAWSDTVEQARVVRWRAGELDEGHRPTEVESLAVERRVRAFRPGDLWVPLDQRSAMAAVFLLEPSSGEGLVRWNAFDTVLEQKEYGEPYVIEPLARRLLEADPGLRARFEAALRDSAFASNPWARTDFFYRRLPWADPEQNLLPVCRALRVPPAGVLAP